MKKIIWAYIYAAESGDAFMYQWEKGDIVDSILLVYVIQVEKKIYFKTSTELLVFEDVSAFIQEALIVNRH